MNGSTPSASCNTQKNWTEYLLEFLMIFLAVFLGFIAENIRERTVEYNRAKEYAKSLLSHLKNDVAELDQSTRFDSLTNLMIDSLVHFINKGVIQSNSGQFYYLSRLANNAKPPLQTNSASLFNSFGNAMLPTKSNRDYLLNDLYRTSKKLAIEIIALIKKKYHLKDD